MNFAFGPHKYPACSKTVSKQKIYILNRFARSNSNYKSWMNDCPYECRVVESYAPDWQVPADAGLIVTHLHYRWEEISALRRIYETTQVPILVLSDGVLEYRNTWENPSVADGSVFQPLIGHKLACIGRSQARTVEAWGNQGKCEIVGMPRLDPVANSEFLPVQSTGPFRILIATANQPAFTPAQREKVVESLRMLRQRFDINNTVNGRPVEVTWRLTDGLENEIGIPVDPDPTNKPIPMSDAIELADAVITTPSTLYLESVLKRRPTAVLDFNNSPVYVPSAWMITAPIHMNPVISELENPPAAKMFFQRSVLLDQLEIGSADQASPARTRLVRLIESMIHCGVQARESGKPLQLPCRILPDSEPAATRVETEFDAATLFPSNPSFRISDVERLQQELNQAIARLAQLPIELERKEQDIKSKNSDIERKDAHIAQLVVELDQLLAKKNADIEKKNQHIDSLGELFQTANSRVKILQQRYREQAADLLELKRQLWPNSSSPADKPKNDVMPIESSQARNAA